MQLRVNEDMIYIDLHGLLLVVYVMSLITLILLGYGQDYVEVPLQ
jgi:hypothetical protein